MWPPGSACPVLPVQHWVSLYQDGLALELAPVGLADSLGLKLPVTVPQHFLTLLPCVSPRPGSVSQLMQANEEKEKMKKGMKLMSVKRKLPFTWEHASILSKSCWNTDYPIFKDFFYLKDTELLFKNRNKQVLLCTIILSIYTYLFSLHLFLLFLEGINDGVELQYVSMF